MDRMLGVMNTQRGYVGPAWKTPSSSHHQMFCAGQTACEPRRSRSPLPSSGRWPQSPRSASALSHWNSRYIPGDRSAGVHLDREIVVVMVVVGRKRNVCLLPPYLLGTSLLFHLSGPLSIVCASPPPAPGRSFLIVPLFHQNLPPLMKPQQRWSKKMGSRGPQVTFPNITRRRAF